MKSRILRLLREPFVHFLLMGAGLFLLFDGLADPPPPPPERIVVDAATIERLQAQHERTWGRPPSERELERIIDTWVRDEILYREALALGLDRDDPVVRQRMRQKVEFLADSAVDLSVPEEETLATYFEANSEAYLAPPQITLSQILISVDRRGASARSDAQQLLVQLNGSQDTATHEQLGDTTLLPSTLENASPDRVARFFGDQFLSQIDIESPGGWQGPVETGFGLHLVRVDALTPARLPSLEEVRDRVEQDWRSARRDAIQTEFYEQLRRGYDIDVQIPSEEVARSAP